MSDLMLSLPQQFFSLYITPDSGGYVYEQCWCVSHVSHATGGGGAVCWYVSHATGGDCIGV